MKAWLKTAAVAVVGGGMPAVLADVLDPAKFQIRYGNGRLALVILQGAAIAVGALFLQSPKQK